METDEQKKQYKNSTAESFASLSIGLWAVSLIGYLTSAISWETYLLAIIGAISALFSLYLIAPPNWKQKSVLESLKSNQITKIVKLLVWLIVILLFGVNLFQTKVIWLIVTGLITMVIAFIVFYIGIFRLKKDNS